MTVDDQNDRVLTRRSPDSKSDVTHEEWQSDQGADRWVEVGQTLASERRGGRYPARPAQRGAHGQSEDQLLHRQCGEGDKVVKASTFERARSLSVHVRLSEIKYCTDVHPADDVRCTREMEVSACRGSPFVFRVPRRLAPPKLFAPPTRRSLNGRTGRQRAQPRSFDTTIRPVRRTSFSSIRGGRAVHG